MVPVFMLWCLAFMRDSGDTHVNSAVAQYDEVDLGVFTGVMYTTLEARPRREQAALLLIERWWRPTAGSETGYMYYPYKVDHAGGLAGDIIKCPLSRGRPPTSAPLRQTSQLFTAWFMATCTKLRSAVLRKMLCANRLCKNRGAFCSARSCC